ncbi:MAG: hypothetical protein HOV77_11090 [Hamadaea sp.]|uniref:hypothetical protein n=1 Tax=Hamadaea sp. TaxID=2024425 RepID=UPI0017E53BAC|nr:hypothetical protein [Hamadaea sp.]NUT19723.1 hypothetical protein [Hamadaea sp.]
MRRVTFSVMAVGAALLLGSPALAADPSPSAAAAAPAQGKKLCKLSDERVGELSGIVATSTGYLAVNTAENVDNPVESHQKIWQLTANCKISGKGIAFGGNGSNSPNDIVRAKDGTMWIADTGNAKERPSVALWKLPAALTTPQIYRLTFPEGDKHEVQALLINGDGTPILVTHENDRTAFLYTPSAALAPGAEGVPLKQVGKIDILTTVTDNMLGGAGRKGFTGGAVAPDGSRVVLRTQADAYEWDVNGNDVLAALKTEPRVTGLPQPAEQYSGAITYSDDGTQFITAPRLDKATDKETASLLSYTPTTKRYVAPPTVKASEGDSALMKWFKDLSLDQVYMLLAGVGFAGLILVGLGVFGMISGKKKRQKAAAAAKKKAKREREALDEFGDADFPGPHDNAPTTVLAPVHAYDDRGRGGYPDQGAGVYGSPQPRPQPGYGQQQQPYYPPQPNPRPNQDPWGDQNRY